MTDSCLFSAQRTFCSQHDIIVILDVHDIWIIAMKSGKLIVISNPLRMVDWFRHNIWETGCVKFQYHFLRFWMVVGYGHSDNVIEIWREKHPSEVSEGRK